MSSREAGKTRLESWKEVGAYFGRGERTVRRWESERGLPIRRLPGSPKSRVYAEVAELEAWRRGAASDETRPSEAPRDAAPAGAARPRFSRWGLAAAALGLVAVAWVATRPGSNGPGTPPPLAAQRLYLAGMDDWARRTPASLNRAVAEFNAAIERDPRYAQAYAGLAASYELMREYTLMPSSQAFPLAKAAAEHALALDDRLADAHAALAFADFYGGWDAAAAGREFRRAIALDPRSATARHWFAIFLMTQADNRGALREIDAARALDPASPAIAADRDVILDVSGQKGAAIADLKRLEAANPAFLSPHNYLAAFALLDGDDEGYLRESGVAAQLTGDRSRLALVAAAARGLRAGGRRGMLAAILAEETARFQNGLTPAFAVARVYALQGDKPRAEAWLRLAFERRETEVTNLAPDAALDTLRGDAAFRKLAQRIELSDRP